MIMLKDFKSSNPIHFKALIGTLLSILLGILIAGNALFDSYFSPSNLDDPWYQDQIPFLMGLFIGIGLASAIILIFIFSEK